MSGLSEHDLQSSETVFFLHIPKTAGTSITSFLVPQFDSRRIWASHEAASILHASDWTAWSLIAGHFPSSLLRNARGEPGLVSLSGFREPVARYLSNLDHLRRVPSRGNRAEGKAAALPTARLLSAEFEGIRARFRDRQSAFVALQIEGNPAEGLDQFDRCMAEGVSLDPDEVIARAKELAWFGLSEDIERSLDLLCFVFGWRPPSEVPHLNAAPSRTKEASLYREQILAENPVDAMLYQWAVQEFELRYREMLARLAEQSGLDRRRVDRAAIREALERHSEARTSARLTPQSSLFFTLDRAVGSRGWHGAEFTAGFPYRWTGPGSLAELDLPIRSSRDVRLRAFSPFSLNDCPREALGLLCNDQPIDAAWTYEGGTAVLAATLPRAVLARRAFARLSFRTAPPVKVAGDDRRLGVCFSWFSLDGV